MAPPLGTELPTFRVAPEDLPTFQRPQGPVPDWIAAIPPPPPLPQPVVAPPERGTLSDIAVGLFKRGPMVTVPHMVGGALKAFGAETTGESIRKAAIERGELPEYKVGTAGEIAAGVAPMLATAATAFIPGVGEVVAPVAAGALFGGSQYTETKEKLMGQGVPQEEAEAAARRTGAIQSVGQAALGYLGGRLLTGPMYKAMSEASPQGALNAMIRPSKYLGGIAKASTIEAAAQVPTQAAAIAGVTATERAYGAQGEPTPGEAALESIGPSLLMGALAGPFLGTAGTFRTNRAKARYAETLLPAPNVAGMSSGQVLDARASREKSLQAAYEEMQKYGKEESMAWRQEAMHAIFNDAEIVPDVNWKYRRPDEAPAEKSPQQEMYEQFGKLPEPTPPGVAQGEEFTREQYPDVGEHEPFVPYAEEREPPQPTTPEAATAALIERARGRREEPLGDPMEMAAALFAPREAPAIPASSELVGLQQQLAAAQEAASRARGKAKGVFEGRVADLQAQIEGLRAPGPFAPERATAEEGARAQVEQQRASEAQARIDSLERKAREYDALAANEADPAGVRHYRELAAQLRGAIDKLRTEPTTEELIAREADRATEAAARDRMEAAQPGLNRALGALEERRGAEPRGMSAEEATARLAAAKAEEPPGQGTARALGLVQEPSAILPGGGYRTRPATKEEHVRALKQELRSAPAEVLNRLAGKTGDELVAEIRKIHGEKVAKSGNAPEAKYVAALEALHKRITGEDIQPAPEEGAGKGKGKASEAATADVSKGAKSEPTTVKTTAETTGASREVHEGERTGAAVTTEAGEGRATVSEPGRPVGYGEGPTTVPAGDISYATEARQQPEGSVGEHPRVEGAREQAPVARAGGRDSALERKALEGRRNALAQAEGEVDRAKDALFSATRDRVEAAKQRSQLLADIAKLGRKPTKEQEQVREYHEEQQRSLAEREAEAKARLAAAQEARDAARAEYGEHFKPEERPAWWRVIDPETGKAEIDPKAGADANVSTIHRWLTLLHHIGLSSPKQDELLSMIERRGTKPLVDRPTAQAKVEMRASYDRAIKEYEHWRLNTLADRYHDALKFEEEMAMRAKQSVRAAEEEAEREAAQAKRVAKAQREFDRGRSQATAAEAAERAHQLNADILEYQNLLDYVVKKGDMTPEEAEAARDDFSMVKKEEANDDAISEKVDDEVRHRILADRHSDKALGERVRANPDARVAMADTARHHKNPFMRATARLLANEHLTAKIVEVENPDFTGARYVPRTDTIEVGTGGMNQLTLMHESIHALVHKALNRALANSGKSFSVLSKSEQQEVSALRAVRDIMDRWMQSEDFNPNSEWHREAARDVHEFLSEALSNPDMQMMLDRRNWWQKFVDKARAVVGLDAKYDSEFNQLLRTTPTLFGKPDSLSNRIYEQQAGQRAYDTRTAYGAVGVMGSLLNAMHSVSPKLATKTGDLLFGEKNRTVSITKEALAWMTHNHVEYLVDRYTRRMKEQFPAASDKLQNFADRFREYRDNVSASKSFNNMLTMEGAALIQRMARFAKKYKQQYEQMTEMGTEASRLGIDPAAKNFDEAKKRNPSLTPEIYNSAAAQALRATYSKMEREAAKVHDPKVDTALKLYHDAVDKHVVDYSRAMQVYTRNILEHHGLLDSNVFKVLRKAMGANRQEYDRLDVMADPYRKMSTREQIFKIQETVRDTRNALDNYLAGYFGVAPNDLQTHINGLAKEPADVADYLSARAALHDMWGLYQHHQQVPYLHLGRGGDYVIKFTVAGGQAEWDRVGKVVDGLKRQWGPPVLRPGHGSNRDVYMRFDDHLKFKDAEKALLDLGLDVFKHPESGDTTWAAGTAEHVGKRTTTSTLFLRTLEKQIEKGDYEPDVKSQMISELRHTFVQSLPETSMLKSSMHRDGDVGYSKDFIKTFEDRLTMGKSALVNSYTAPLMGRSMNELSAAAREVDRSPGMGEVAAQLGMYRNELRARVGDTISPVHSPLIDKMRALPAAWRLMLSPAYMITTAFQPWQVTLPYIGGKYGHMATMKLMATNTVKSIHALGLLFKMGWADPNMKGLSAFDKLAGMSALQLEFANLKDSKNVPIFNKNDLTALDHLSWSGLINYSQTNQFARLNPEDRSAYRKFSDIATMMPHYIELVNRMTAALTAHEMVLRNEKGSPEAVAKQARDFALQTVRDTDGDHSSANIARRLGRQGVAKQLTPLAVGFGQYNIQMTENIIRQVMNFYGGTGAEKKQAAFGLAGLGVTTGLLAGSLGLPFVALYTAIANTVGNMFRDANDVPYDAQAAWRNFLDAQFPADDGGKKMAEMLAHGVFRGIGADFSTRAGMHEVAPWSGFLTDRRRLADRLDRGALELLGPAVGVGAGLFKGMQAFNDGDMPGFIDEALPAQARNMARAYRLAKYGYQDRSASNRILPVEVTPWDIFLQAGGVTGSARAEQSERYRSKSTTQELMQHRHQVLQNEIVRAMDVGDMQKMNEAYQLSIDFSVRHGLPPPDVTSMYKQRMMERYLGGALGTGFPTTKRDLPVLHAYQFGMPPGSAVTSNLR